MSVAFSYMKTVRLIIVLAAMFALVGMTRSASADDSPRWGMLAIKPGSRFVGNLHYRNESNSDLRPVFAGMQAGLASPAPGLVRQVGAELKGRLELVMLRNSSDGAIMQLKIRQAEIGLVVDGRSSMETEKRLSELLSNGLFVSIGAQGQISGVWFKADTDAIGRGVVSTIAALLQIVTPEKGVVLSWNAEESDPSGQYSANYSLVSDLVWKKHKQRYLEQQQTRSARQVQQINYLPTGGLEIEFFKDHTLRRISGQEELKLYVGGRDVGKSVTQLRIELEPARGSSSANLARLQKQFAALSRQIGPSALFSRQNLDENDRLLYRQKLGSSSIADLLQEISAVEKEAKGYDDTDLYLRLKAIIFIQPKTAHTLAQTAVAAQTRSRTFRLIVSALASIGHPQAQQGVLTIIESRRKDADSLVELLPLLGLFDTPTPAVENVLRDFAYKRNERDVSFTAQLALGAMAGKMAETDRQHSKRLLDEFLAHYPKPSSEDDISRVLLVLGNAGIEQYLPVILPYLQDQRVEVRVDAIHALRHFSVGLVGKPILDALLSDREASVRYEAANALSYMALEETQIAALQASYSSELVPGVRGEIIKTIWKFEKRFTGLWAFVQQAAQNDSSEEVRKLARGLIGQ